MDAEMVTAYIRFEKGKESRDLKAEAEQQLSDPKTLATYAAWIVGGAGFGYIRKTITRGSTCQLGATSRKDLRTLRRARVMNANDHR